MGDREDEDFWAEQDRLPLHKRDRVWWASVGFSRAVFGAIGLAIAAGIAAAVVNAVS